MHTNAHKWAKKRDMKWHAFFRSTINTVRHTPLLMEEDKREWDRIACGERADELHMCKHWQRDRLERKGGDIVRMGPKTKFVVFGKPTHKKPYQQPRWGARKKKKKGSQKKGKGGGGENLCDNLFVWPVTNEFLCYTMFIRKGKKPSYHH